MVYDKNGKAIKSSKQIKSAFDRFNYDNFLNEDGYPNDDLVDECIRIVEWYNGEEPDFNESFERYYERRINRGEDKKEARKSATKSALIDICGDVSEFRKMVESYCSSKGCDDIPNALSFANLPPEEKDERTPQEKWEDHVYSKDEVKSSKTITSNKEPADMDMAKDLALFAENDVNIYNQIIDPTFKNLERKLRKGIYDKDKAIIAWENVIDKAAAEYDKKMGSGRGTMTMFSKPTRHEAAKILMDSICDDDMWNPIKSSKKPIISTVDFPQDGNEFANLIDKVLDEHHIGNSGAYFIPRKNVFEVDIDGDWKHDHLTADHLLFQELGLSCIDTREVGDSDSDWYEAVHTYQRNSDIEDFHKRMADVFKNIESSKKNINSSWEEDVDFVVDQFMNEWMENHPDSTTEEYTAARKKYHDWVYERV